MHALFLTLFVCISAQESATFAEQLQQQYPWNFAQGGRDWGGTCATGHFQSPVDIVTAETETISDPQFGDVWLNIDPQILTLDPVEPPIFTGIGTIQAILNSTLFTYTLTQIHFHLPSEQTINGVRYPLEMHLSFRPSDESNFTAVGIKVSALFQEGASNSVIDNFLGNDVIDLSLLLPTPVSDYFFYSGGREVPVPDCDEPFYNVIINELYEVGRGQVEALAEGIYAQVIADSGEHGMYKDTQPRNGRSMYHRVPPVQFSSFLA